VTCDVETRSLTSDVHRSSCDPSPSPSAPLRPPLLQPVERSAISAEVCRPLPVTATSRRLKDDDCAGVFSMSFDDGDASGSRAAASVSSSSMSKSDPFFPLIYGRDVNPSACAAARSWGARR
jgi:hypothetical protein